MRRKRRTMRRKIMKSRKIKKRKIMFDKKRGSGGRG